MFKMSKKKVYRTIENENLSFKIYILPVHTNLIKMKYPGTPTRRSSRIDSASPSSTPGGRRSTRKNQVQKISIVKCKEYFRSLENVLLNYF